MLKASIDAGHGLGLLGRREPVGLLDDSHALLVSPEQRRIPRCREEDYRVEAQAGVGAGAEHPGEGHADQANAADVVAAADALEDRPDHLVPPRGERNPLLEQELHLARALEEDHVVATVEPRDDPERHAFDELPVTSRTDDERGPSPGAGGGGEEVARHLAEGRGHLEGLDGTVHHPRGLEPAVLTDAEVLGLVVRLRPAQDEEERLRDIRRGPHHALPVGDPVLLPGALCKPLQTVAEVDELLDEDLEILGGGPHGRRVHAGVAWIAGLRVDPVDGVHDFADLGRLATGTTEAE